MSTSIVEFCWGKSRGRATYGYTICSLCIDGKKVGSCNGGGYDMQGAVLGDWIASKYADRLMRLTIPWTTRHGEPIQEYYGLTYRDPAFDVGKSVPPSGLVPYQEFSTVPSVRHTVPSIDGTVGLGSVFRIAEAIGLTYRRLVSRQDIYLMEDTYPSLEEDSLWRLFATRTGRS